MTGLRGNYGSHDDFTLEKPPRCGAVDGSVNGDAAFVGFGLAEQEKRI